MTTKFNKDMYAKMRSKKDEPLSSIGKKGVRVTGKGPSVTPVTSATPIVSAVETVRTASPATSVEEIPLPPRRGCVRQARRGRRMILIRPPCGATGVWLWTECMGS